MSPLHKLLAGAGRFYLRTARDLEDQRPVGAARRLAFSATDFAANQLLPRISGVTDVLRHRTIARGAHLGFVARANRELDETGAVSASPERPASWTSTAAAKLYPGAARIALRRPERTGDLYAAMTRRASLPEMGFARPPTVDELATVLGYSFGALPDGRRAQPSGGGLYPLELYVAATAVGDDALAPGLYHYDWTHHALEVLDDANQGAATARIDRHGIFPTMLILTAVLERNERKYREYGLELALLEAGHVGHAVYLVSASMGLGCRALGLGNVVAGPFYDGARIDGDRETVIYSLALGHARAAWDR